MAESFRQRSRETTRLETFVDAAFAFAVTLLVISVDGLPASYGEFLDALTKIPVFFTCFALMSMFWWAHNRWSRRYGLEDAGATLLSLLLVAIVLVYVYPLRVVFESYFAYLSGGALAADFTLSLDQLGTLFIVFGCGFAALSGITAALYLHAYRKREQLDLNPLERFDTLSDILAWVLVAATAMVSTVLAVLLPPAASPLAGIIYWSLMLTMPVTGWWQRRRRAQLVHVSD